jgi:hypothetical protein
MDSWAASLPRFLNSVIAKSPRRGDVATQPEFQMDHHVALLLVMTIFFGGLWPLPCRRLRLVCPLAMTSEEAGQRPRPTFLEQDGQDASLLA